jgi:ATP-dependent RNA helicase DDX24/MAK5
LQRGVGEGAVGCSLSLIASGEDKFYSKIVNALKIKFTTVPMDGRLLAAAQERVNLATKVAASEDAERKATRDNQWFREQAEEAGLDVDDDMLEEAGVTGDVKRDRARQSEAASARQRLRDLLAQPIQTQRFGKFLSTNSAATQRVRTDPTMVAPSKNKKKRRKR